MTALTDLLNGKIGNTGTVTSGSVYVGPRTVKGVRGGTDVVVDDTLSVTDKINEFYSWTDAQYNAFVSKLKSQNYISKTSKTDPGTIRDIWISAVNEASTYYSATGGAKKMTVDGILGLYAKSSPVDKGPALPSRQIYEYSESDVKSLINEVYQSTVMRNATDAEINSRLASVKAKLSTGTLSTTQKAKNAVTGKMENVTTQTPGPTKEDVKTSIADELKKMNPDEVDRKARIDFSGWLSQNVKGA